MTPAPFRVETIELDLPAVVGALSRRLHAAGVPVSAERASGLARALSLVAPIGRRRLYWTVRAAVVTEPGQLTAFDAVFAAVFGAGASDPADPKAEPETVRQVRPPADDPPETAPDADPGRADAQQPSAASGAPPRGRDEDPEPLPEVPIASLASDEEVIRTKRFDAMDPAELARVYALMTRLSLATPRRLTRRACPARTGPRVDLRRTLRASLRTGGDPIRLARRRRRVQPRRIVLLCDISGSMEPYARAYLQFLTCVAGSGPRAESFVFATRLTRLTRALRSRHPERAIAQAAATAPDWSSGTRIGDALKTFNDRHGRRGMARGAVVVILSDGWERGDPGVVGREMERLARLAHRIVWVNPRVAAAGFSPRAGGMAAALPHCDALVSGHSLEALSQVADAIAADGPFGAAADPGWHEAREDAADEEPWASATDWAGSQAGSSVAMPSGYGPRRGRTTPGWGRS